MCKTKVSLSFQEVVLFSMVLIGVFIPLASSYTLASDVGIRWEAINRFRLVKGAQEEDRYRRDMKRITSDDTHKGINKFSDPVSDKTKGPYKTYWEEGKDVYDANYLSPGGNRGIALTPQLPSKMQRKATCIWRIDNQEEVNDSECQGIQRIITEGKTHSVALRVRFDGKDQVAQTTITLKDLIIVALGDSYGAGEGVPEINAHIPNGNVDDVYPSIDDGDAEWQDKRCHRSLFSGFNQAVLEFTKNVPDRHVTLLDFTCSGATIKTRQGEGNERKGGLLDPYEGRELRKRPLLKPQVEAAGRALCQEGQFMFNAETHQGECKKPALVDNADILTLVSVGGNDIGFANVVEEFVKHKSQKQVDQVIQRASDGLIKLASDYTDLDNSIRSSYRSKITMIVEYPDPTHDEKGNFTAAGPFCRRSFLKTSLGYITITEGEHRRAYEEVLVPLNDTIKKVADKLKWTYVGGMMKATEKKGICANPSNFSWIYASIGRTEGFSGVYHPNIFGHLRYSEAIYPELKKAAKQMVTPF